LSIAIVVEVVLARFGAWRDFARAWPPRSTRRIARLCSALANTDPRRSGSTRITASCREWYAEAACFIDLAIAIVIDGCSAIFGGCRLHVLHAGDHPRRTRRRSGRAYARVASVAHLSATWIAFVDQAIAIVVETVARFQHGLSGDAWSRHSIGACRHRDDTSSHAASDIGKAIVNHAITIVIETIARFIHSLSRRACVGHSIGACGHRDGTSSYAAGDTRKAIVNHAIAVVIETIARFIGRLSRRARRRHSVRARRHCRSTGANTARDAGNTVVRHTIAVVIEAIARFRARCYFARTTVPRAIHTRLLSRSARTNVHRRR
jgi:hypothetical protein